MHAGQLRVDAAAVRTLLRQQYTALGHEPVTLLPAAGTVNAIFRIGDGFTARFPMQAEDPAVATAALDRETAAMAELAEHCPFPTPRPVHVGHPSASYPMPWSIQTWVAGETATPVGHESSNVLAADLANLIGALRAVDTRGRRFDGGGRGGHLPDHDEWLELCFRNSEGLLDVARLRALWERLRGLPSAGPDAMSHGDLTPANLLVAGEHLVGVLDDETTSL